MLFSLGESDGRFRRIAFFNEITGKWNRLPKFYDIQIRETNLTWPLCTSVFQSKGERESSFSIPHKWFKAECAHLCETRLSCPQLEVPRTDLCVRTVNALLSSCSSRTAFFLPRANPSIALQIWKEGCGLLVWYCYAFCSCCISSNIEHKHFLHTFVSNFSLW